MNQEILTNQDKLLIEKWKTVLDELDNTEKCNERRHKEKRDILDITLCQCQNDNDDYISSKIKLKLSTTDENWIDWIFSKNSADLYQLTESKELSK